MLLRGDRRQSSATSRAFAAGAALVVVLGQFFALSHEIAVRHVRCAEHGELTHVASMVGAGDAEVPHVSAFRTEEVATLAGHDHCATALTVQTGVAAQVLPCAVAAAPPPPRVRAESAPPRERAFLLASAPKTSPPAA